MSVLTSERVLTPSNEPDRIALAGLVMDRLNSREMELALFAGGPVPREAKFWPLARIVSHAVDGLAAIGTAELYARAARVGEVARRYVNAETDADQKYWAGMLAREQGYRQGISWRLHGLGLIVFHERGHDDLVARMGFADGRCRALWCERCRPAEHIAIWQAGGEGAKALEKSWGRSANERVWYVARTGGSA